MLVEFGSRLFQQIVGILLGTNCAALRNDLFLFLCESSLQTLIKNKEIKEAKPFHFTIRYIHNVLSFNNPKFSNLVSRIYHQNYHYKTTETDSTASYLDLYLKSQYQNLWKKTQFEYWNWNFSFLWSNILTSPASGIDISKLSRNSGACSCYRDFIEHQQCLSRKLTKLCYTKERFVWCFFFKYIQLV